MRTCVLSSLYTMVAISIKIGSGQSVHIYIKFLWSMQVTTPNLGKSDYTVYICKNIYCGFRVLIACSRDVTERIIIAGEYVLKNKKHKR